MPVPDSSNAGVFSDSRAVMISRAAALASVALVIYWVASDEPFMFSHRQPSTFAWTGAVAGYVFIPRKGMTRQIMRATAASAVSSWILLIALLIESAKDYPLALYGWVPLAGFAWAFNLALVSLRLRVSGTHQPWARSRREYDALSVARVAAIAVALIALSSLLQDAFRPDLPDWIRYAVLGAALDLMPWLCAAAAAITAAVKLERWMAAAVSVLLLLCASDDVGWLLESVMDAFDPVVSFQLRDGADWFAFLLTVGLLAWITATEPASRKST